VKIRKLPFDKYDLYLNAVQSPDGDVQFYRERYKEFFKAPKKGLTLREDFCGAGAISCEWVKLHKENTAAGLDLDEEPMSYGRKNYIDVLTEDQKRRVTLVKKNVLDRGLPKADISVAVNFSYFIFKDRQVLKDYFVNVYNSLKGKGLFIVDVFGGTACTDVAMDRTPCKGFTYYWEQKNWDPVTNYASFGIHFKYKGKMYKNLFTYDWRMWSIPEIKEIMIEAGFSETAVYWEGSKRDGSGNGIFSRVKEGEPCLSWIAYVVGVKN
jgi:cyclopropane fatty-acyl-phospholipid synthase-like methyltransferase